MGPKAFLADMPANVMDMNRHTKISIGLLLLA